LHLVALKLLLSVAVMAIELQLVLFCCLILSALSGNNINVHHLAVTIVKRVFNVSAIVIHGTLQTTSLFTDVSDQ